MSLSSKSRSEELMAHVPKTERAPEIPASFEEEPKVESFAERGDRILAEAAAKVTSTWAGLRSRLSSFGDRLKGIAKTGIGAGAAGLETGAIIAGKTLGAQADYVRSIPTMAKEIAKDAREGLTDFAGSYHDMVRPREAADMEAVTAVEQRMQRLREMMTELDPGPGRDELVAKYEGLEAERAKLLDTPRYTRGSKAAAEAAALLASGGKKALTVGAAVAMAPVLGAAAAGAGLYNGGARAYGAVAEKIGEMREARRVELEERRIEHEQARVARAELFLLDAAEKSGQPVPQFGREQLIFLGTKLEESLARRVGSGIKELAKGVLLVDDVVDIGKNLFYHLPVDSYHFAKEPENWRWFAGELKTAGIEIPKSLLMAASDVGLKTVAEPGLTALQAGAGLALAGAEAAINSAPVRAAKEAVVAEWEERKPAIQKGVASTVESLNAFGDNLVNLPDDAVNELNNLAEKVNNDAERVLGFFDRMKRIVDSAVAVAKRKFNEFMLEVAQGAAKTENPELVAKIGDAVQALETVEAEQARPTSSYDAPPVPQTGLRRPRPQTIPRSNAS